MNIKLYKKFLLPKKVLKMILLRIDDNSQFEKTKHQLEIYLVQKGYEISDVKIMKYTGFPFINKK